MNTPAPDPAFWQARGLALPINPMTAAALRAAGWTPRDLARALARDELVRLARGRYAPVRQLTPEASHERLARIIAADWPGAAVSHVSAAVLHGLPVRRAGLGRVHLTREGGGHGRRTPTVVLHRARLADHEWELLDGVRVTTLERTVADLARREPFAWGVAAADAALRRQAERAVLEEYVASGRRRAGNGRLRAVLGFANPRAESALESVSRVSMAIAGLPAPIVQFRVVTGDGEWVAECDFGWPEHGLVGEADGRVKYDEGVRHGKSPTDVVLVEKGRDDAIRDCGLWVSHWGWREANDPDALGRRLWPRFRSA